MQVVSGGAAGNWGWNNLAPRILRGELDTCFFVKHFVKDMKIALEECERMQLELPGLSLVASLYENLMEHGEENLGTQALIQVIKRMNNIPLDLK
jgi:3-hydroxyisobutyrate dehydrogenase